MAPNPKFGKSSGKVREKFGKELSERELAVAEFIEAKGSVASSEVMELVHVTDRGAQRILKRLIEKKVAEKTGSGRRTRYTLANE